MILALLFVVLMIMVGGIYVVSHAHELFVISAQAIEYPREVLASFIKGVAHR